MARRYFYVPMPLNAAGNGPADPHETMKVIHQVWDEENIAVCSCDYRKTAEEIASSLNRGERDAITIQNIIETLQDCEEYFDNKADADCDQDGFIPNKEMVLLSKVQEALSKLGDSQKLNLIHAASGLKRIVEEIDGSMNHGTWRDDRGQRLKDTTEWVEFYNALSKATA